MTSKRGLKTGKLLGAFGITQNTNMVLRSSRMGEGREPGTKVTVPEVHVLGLHWTKQEMLPPPL